MIYYIYRNNLEYITVYIMMHVKDVHIFEFGNLVLVFARGIRASVFPDPAGNRSVFTKEYGLVRI